MCSVVAVCKPCDNEFSAGVESQIQVTHQIQLYNLETAVCVSVSVCVLVF